MNNEESIARLEEQAFFQERLLDRLNEALAFQQKQIDVLQNRVDDLENMLKTLLDNAEAPVNTLPPHYMPERY